MSAIKKNADGRTATIDKTGVTGTARDKSNPASRTAGSDKRGAYKAGREEFGAAIPNEGRIVTQSPEETFDVPSANLVGVDPYWHPAEVEEPEEP